MRQMILFLTIFSLLSLVLFKVYAQEILTSQSKTALKDINCTKVTDTQFEKLGDAVMQVMAGSEQAHNYMDQMMGGEGSQSLKAAHIRMGRAYLGCETYGMIGMIRMMRNYLKGGGFPMMGYGGYGMTGGANFGVYPVVSILWIITWVLVIVVLVAFIRWMWKKGDKVK